MRLVAVVFLVACAVSAQFKSGVSLVVAPTTVTDSKGRYVDGLAAEDLILYDNNVRQTTRTEWTTYPISLVVVV
jgi:hypothetical protein